MGCQIKLRHLTDGSLLAQIHSGQGIPRLLAASVFHLRKNKILPVTGNEIYLSCAAAEIFFQYAKALAFQEFCSLIFIVAANTAFVDIQLRTALF